MNYSTTNYALFNNNPKQRKYNPLKTARLVEIMRRGGFKESLCISVYKEKGKLYINAGHHRVEAAKILKLAVWYVIESKWASDELAREGTSASNWSTREICEMYAADGIDDYAELLSYTQHGIAPEMAAAMMGGTMVGGRGVKDTINNGTFRVRSKDHIEAVLQVIRAIVEKYPEARSRNFIGALSAFLKLDGFSSDRFITSIQCQPKIEKCATGLQMMEQLDEMYNYRQRIRDNISFRAKEALRRSRIGNINKASAARKKSA